MAALHHAGRHPDRAEESEEILINFDCLQIWKFTFISRENVRFSFLLNAPQLVFTFFFFVCFFK